MMSERVISTRLELNGAAQYRQKVQDAAKALGTLGDEAGRAGEALERGAQAARLSEKQVEALWRQVRDAQAWYKLLSKAQKETQESGALSASTLSKLLEKYPELSRYLVEVEGGYKLADGAVEDYIATQRAEYQIALNDAQTAANAIINAEAGKINAINATTLAAKDQLRALAELYQSMGKNAENQAEGGSYLELARQYKEAADKLEDAGKSLESFDRITATLGRASSGASGKSGSSRKSTTKEKTRAELDLEAYQAAVKELDHLRAMEQVSEEDYYKRKAALGDAYLKDNKEQRQKLDEELYQWQKGAWERELSALQEALEAEKLTREEYFASLQALQDKYFQEGTEAWRTAEEQRRQEVRRVNQAAYDQELSDNKYFKDMGLISEEEYYARLAELRDKYLEENSEEWRRANVELHSYLEQRRQEELRAAEEAYNAQADALKKALDERLAAAKDAYSDELDALKQAYGEQKDAAKAAYSEKKAQIQAELDLEKKRLNAVIDGIDAEIQARRALREDEDQDDAIAKSRKRLEQAQNELAYARTSEDRAQWEKEVVRLQEALEKAIQDKEDTAFYREKEAEKEAVKEQIAAAEEKAKGEQSAAQSAYDEQLGRLEADYDASVEKVKADYEASVRRLEAEYGAALDRLERRREEQAGSGGSALDPEVLAIARANNVSYSDARDMRDANRRNEGNPNAPHYSDGGYSERAASAGKALAGIVGAVASAGTSLLGGAVSNIVNHNNRSASVTVNSGGTPTEGQLARTVEKVLSKLGR